MIRGLCGIPDVNRSWAVSRVLGGAARRRIHVAHNLAWSIAERQDAGATLVDSTSPSERSVSISIRIQPTVADAWRRDRVDEVFWNASPPMTATPGKCSPPGDAGAQFELDPSYEMVIERVRRTSLFIVLDLPHVWTSG